MAIKKSSVDVRKLVYLAILTAIVFVLQALAPIIGAPLQISPSFVLVPMVVGVAMCGTWAGAWLGLMFALSTFCFDAKFLALFEYNAIGSIVTILGKCVLAGIASGLVYKALVSKKKYLAIILAAITAPIVNTGVFILGLIVFFKDHLIELFEGQITSVVMLLGLFLSINFILEFVTNLILVPTIYRIIEINKKHGSQ